MVDFLRPEIKGWIEGIFPYYKTIAQNLQQGAKIVEVGVYEGRSALFMIEELERLDKSALGHFFRIDILPRPHWLSGKNITHMQMTSEQASNSFDDNSLDFVFIDAGHEYEDVISDIKYWFPKVRSGGIISGHDYNDTPYVTGVNKTLPVDAHPGVIRAVNESFGEKNITLPSGSVWQYIK